ncbi:MULTISPECIES: shikimate kinase [unclassified Archaeoglobus]|jgi:shikimate kinase|uniref:shikimate kinase n=1 Tax=unclassified Archaeoglobus TaxID=2643606 RepID=UPI0025BBE589|nr:MULTISPECIES: shikimate kinase [unclassified Archaeoglobus]
MKGIAYAAGTIVNALATGIGSAFGIDMQTVVKLKPGEGDEIKVVVNGVERKSVVAERILRAEGISGEVVVESEIPSGSGLGSSSAFVNALLVAVKKLKGEIIDAYEILKTNARVSLEAGISYTGAFDDAAASLLGGFVVSDNYKMRLYRWDRISSSAAILIPHFKRGKVNWKEIRANSTKLRPALEDAIKGDYCSAMKRNTRYYCEMIGYPLEIAMAGWDIGVCCGLSGNGPTFVAFGSKSEMKSLADVWKEYGEVYIRKVIENSVSDFVIPKSLFIKF